jgi:NhaP-type Na+/H+ and K+/H+ antiporter
MAGLKADGARVAELGLGEGAWLNLARRDGELLPLRNDTRLRSGDQVLVQGDSGGELGILFHRRRAD